MSPNRSILAGLLWPLGLFATPSYQTTPPTAAVGNGSYSGSYLGGGLDVNQYLGIKYANAPRFARPTALNETWEGSRNATQFGYSCVQVALFGAANQGEDCLNLNVWQPSGTAPSASLPVLLWIYGGGLVGGSASSPLYNMSQIVQTSINM